MRIDFVLGLLVVGIALFSTEVLPVDVVTLLLLVALVALVVDGVLTPGEAFAPLTALLLAIVPWMVPRSRGWCPG